MISPVADFSAKQGLPFFEAREAAVKLQATG